ncbi:polymer-forming cytoskeletal protein [Deinococcus budaensis]|uniref:Polymer-forming cytoskeletal protein n=1 Tax=Deinococcus budaensis TaxID=1665626 RepID=A0A7W8GIC0_9DEIO|nr:polymer-forming cytoskeletal protein [Deinococcus budaensis]MBB5236008.1 hypothetical protein [Deinococcus budaensis]
MGVERAVWLDLLHREAEGEVTPAERAQLLALDSDAALTQVRRELARATAALTALPRPPLPQSQAAEVASEIAWSARMQAAPPAGPPRPGAGVAAWVVAEVRLDRELARLPAPTLPRSVAAAVAARVQVAAVLGQAPAPALPHSLTAALPAEIGWAARLQAPAPALPRSVAGAVASRIAREGQAEAAPPDAAVVPPRPVHNPAPLLLVGGLLAGLTLLGVTQAWPNLAAGATVLQTLVAQVSPLAGVGLVLLLLVSALVAWRPTPAVQRLGAGAFVLAAVLTLPPLYGAFGRSGVTVGQDVSVRGPVAGNVIAIGGDVRLEPGARVGGEVITLFGDVQRDPAAQVEGRVNALLGRAPGDAGALQTAPPSGLPGLGLATASAFRPLLGWLGGAAWSRIFVLLTGGMLGLLFVTGAAPLLARRQRHAPVRTLALGVLALALLVGPALGLALTGLLVPALFATAFALLLVATGLSVSAYDAGRTLACRLHLPLPDAVGALIGLSVVAASLSVPPLALTFALVGGAWGAGTLLLTRSGQRAA